MNRAQRRHKAKFLGRLRNDGCPVGGQKRHEMTEDQLDRLFQERKVRKVMRFKRYIKRNRLEGMKVPRGKQ